MGSFNPQKHWWVVVTAAAVVGIAAIVLVDEMTDTGSPVGVILFLFLIGASFCWVYFINQERLWWAIIPGLGAFTFLAAFLPDLVFGIDPKNDWLNVLVIGIGSAITGLLLKRMDAKAVLYSVSAISFIVAIAMAPFAWVLKGVLIAVVVVVTGYFMWTNRETLGKSS